MKNYIIPYGQRFVQMGNTFGGYATLMCVDGIGLVVKHESKNKPTDNDVRSHLIGWSEQNAVFIQANSLEEAIKEFYDFPECKIGLKHKAWELIDSKENPIIEYSACEHIRIMANGCTACAYYGEPEKKGWMCCILDRGEGAPSVCPINHQIGHKGWREEIIQMGGMWVKRYIPVVAESESIINGVIPV